MKRTLKLSKWIFAVIIISLFTLSIPTLAKAAYNNDDYNITNLRQANAYDDTVFIRWDSKGFYRFDVWFSTTQDGTYTKLNAERTNATGWFIEDLKPGKSYYVKIQGYVYGDTYTITTKPLEVVTQPELVSSIKQTAGTTSKISISWTSSNGATGYYVYKYNKDRSKLLASKIVTGTKTTISASAGKIYSINVVPFRDSKSKYRAMNTYKYDYISIGVYSAPGKATNVADSVAYNRLQYSFSWTPCKTDYSSRHSGLKWKVEIYSLNGKKLGTASTSDIYCDVKSNKMREYLSKNGYKVRVRASYLHDNMLLTGQWSDFKVVIPAANVSNSFYKIKGTTYKVKWDPIKNASYYYIYVNRNNGKGKWNSLKLNNKQTSYVIKNIKKGQTVKAYVVPVVKVNGKYVKGTMNDLAVTTLIK